MLFSSNVVADETGAPDEPPPYKMLRAAEDYSYLVNDEDRQYEYDWFDPIKYMPMTDDGSVRLTIGGEFRPRYEYFKNRNWTADADDGFYSQRVSVHC